MHNTPNAYWTVLPNIRLEPGIYAITDSDPATWSQNSGSGGFGFVKVFGKPIIGSSSTSAQPTTTPQNSDEVTIPSNTNLTPGKTATQSSTGYGGSPDRALDGKTDGNYNGGSVSHTNKQGNPWWQVDLKKSFNIKTIRIWNRTDCCGERLTNFYVLVSDTPFASVDLKKTVAQPGVWNSHFPGTAGVQTDIQVHKTGRYVRIQLNGSNYLSLAEVQIISE